MPRDRVFAFGMSQIVVYTALINSIYHKSN